MAITTTRIDEFKVMYSSNTFAPRIWLNSGGKGIGQLVFFPNGKQLPPDILRSNGQVDLHYHLDDFQNLRDLLETEKETYLLFCSPQGENGILTSADLVGTGVEVKAA